MLKFEDYYYDEAFINEKGEVEITYYGGSGSTKTLPVNGFGIDPAEHYKFKQRHGLNSDKEFYEYLNQMASTDPLAIVGHCDDPHCSFGENNEQRIAWVDYIKVKYTKICWFNKDNLSRFKEELSK